jgi:hypothetical protein
VVREMRNSSCQGQGAWVRGRIPTSEVGSLAVDEEMAVQSADLLWDPEGCQPQSLESGKF